MDSSILIATVFGAVLGGLFTIAGGIAGSYLLEGLEQRRENKRQRDRHATAVRIVIFELRGIGAAHIMAATGAPYREMSKAGYDSLALDLFSLLPDQLASDVAFAYSLVGVRGTAEGAKAIGEKVTFVVKALTAYAEGELGLRFSKTGIP